MSHLYPLMNYIIALFLFSMAATEINSRGGVTLKWKVAVSVLWCGEQCVIDVAFLTLA